MSKGLEVKKIIFGELRKISSKEFRDSTGMNMPWDGLVDSADIKLILANSSEETKKAYIYIIARPDILPTSSQFTSRTDVEVKPGEEREVNYVVPMFGIPSSDYRDYTGPWRCAVDVTVSNSPKVPRWTLNKVKYYDIPAKVEVDELEESKFDIHKALDELEKTTLLNDFHIEGSPKGNVKSIKAKLFNFGENTQYIGIDIRAERRKKEHNWGYGGQFFYEIKPKEEIPVDINLSSCLPMDIPLEYLMGMEYLRIRAASIPEYVFKSQKARAWFIWRSYEEEENYKSLIAKFDFYFKEGEV